MMTSQSVIKLDVGGQIFQTTISTLSKYPGSMLSAMFSHTDAGIVPMPKTEAGHFFLDVNPNFFEIVLEWLRLGEIITDDPSLLKGTLALANYFGLDKLLEELKVFPKKNKGKYPEMLQSEILHIIFEDLGTLEFVLKQNDRNGINKYNGDLIVRKTKITRVPESLIARYFNGEEIYFPIAHDVKSGYFVIECGNGPTDFSEYYFNVFQFLDADDSKVFEENVKIYPNRFNEIKKRLGALGIHEGAHYKAGEYVKKETGGKCCYFQWNKEFVMKHVASD